MAIDRLTVEDWLRWMKQVREHSERLVEAMRGIDG